MVVVIDFIVAILAFVVAVVAAAAVVLAVLVAVAVAVLAVAMWVGETPHFHLYFSRSTVPADIRSTCTNAATLHFRFQAAVETPSLTCIILHVRIHIQTQIPYWVTLYQHANTKVLLAFADFQSPLNFAFLP